VLSISTAAASECGSEVIPRRQGEFGANGIRANALLPGGSDTPALTANTAEERAFIENLHALKRLARPDGIARSAPYPASDASSFMTGIAPLRRWRRVDHQNLTVTFPNPCSPRLCRHPNRQYDVAKRPSRVHVEAEIGRHG